MQELIFCENVTEFFLAVQKQLRISKCQSDRQHQSCTYKTINILGNFITLHSAKGFEVFKLQKTLPLLLEKSQ